MRRTRFAQLMEFWTVRGLARKARVSESAVAYYRDKGIEHATVGRAVRLAEALGTTVEDMVGKERDE